MSRARHTVIRNGFILNVATSRVEPADMLISDGLISEIGSAGLPAPGDATPIDASGRMLIPGLINAHTHAHGGLAKGMVADRVPLEMFLSTAGALFGGRSVEEKYLSALVSAVEMIRKGCTASYDLVVEYPAPSIDGINAVAQAYIDVGMRAVIAPMMADRTLYQALPGLIETMPEPMRAEAHRLATATEETNISACRAILRNWPFDRDRVRPAIAPTIPLHCSDSFLVACRDLCRDFDLGLQTHLAETKAQAVLGLKRYGKSLTAHLQKLGLLSERLTVAHAIWLSPDDIARLSDAGAKVVHNPLSNLRLGSGVAPIRAMIDRGLTVGIGTDAVNTSDAQNMFEATRLAAYLSHLESPDYRSWVGVDEAFTMATRGGAAALGWSDHIGRLAPGFRADIVFIDLTHINYVPLNNAGLQFVNGENGGAVDSVMIDGRMILDRGRLTTIDEAKLRRDAQQAAHRLIEMNATNLEHARSLGDLVGLFCLGQARMRHSVHRLLPDAELANQVSD